MQGEFLKFGVVGERCVAGADDDQQVVLQDDAREGENVGPVVEYLKFAVDVVSFLMQDVAQYDDCVVVGVENDTASDLLADVGNAVDPFGKSALVFGFFGYGHDDAGGHVDGNGAFGDGNHFVGAFEQVLDFGAEEAVNDVALVVQAQYDFGDVLFFDGVDDAAGDVRVIARETHELDVRGGGDFGGAVEQHLSHIAGVKGCFVVVDDVHGIDGLLLVRAFGQYGEIDEVFERVRVGYGYENACLAGIVAVLVVLVGRLLGRHFFCRPFGGEGADGAGDQNHDDGAVENVDVEHADVISDEDGGQSRGRLPVAQAENHGPVDFGEPEILLGNPGCQPFGHSGNYRHDNGYKQGVPAREDDRGVDEHTHADEEVGYEKGVAHKFDAVHQG